MKPSSINIPLALLSLSLAGCAVGPDYKRPAVAAPTAWRESITATNSAVLPPEWWRVFEDAELDALEAQAVASNQDLKNAAARVSEARALTRISKADRYPSVLAGAEYSRGRQSESRDNVPPKLNTEDFNTSFEASYELDIWGRVRRSTEAAKASGAAVAADLQVVLLTLTADVARNFQLIHSLDNERIVIQATIALRKDAAQLQSTRYHAGLINEVDVTRARTELANVEAEFHSITRRRAQLEHAIAVLCGQPPANFSISTKASAVRTPDIPAGLPSELLKRRPDVAAAEYALEAANARIGVAKAAFFPTIKLTGSAGYASADLVTLADWPSRIASFGPSVSVPLFQGGRNRANLKAAEARYEQGVAAYGASILNAFREVEDALSDIGALTAQSEAIVRALNSARDTFSLASQRYEQGLSNYLDVVDAQRAVLQAERQEIQLRGERATAVIYLAKALGGGWERAEPLTAEGDSSNY